MFSLLSKVWLPAGIALLCGMGFLLLFEAWRLLRLWRKASEQITYLLERSAQEMYKAADAAEDIVQRGERMTASVEAEMHRNQSILGTILSFFIKR